MPEKNRLQYDIGGNMIRRWKNITNKKYFHIVVVIVMIVLILFVLGIIVLRYHVEGETNMPFELSKIAIISSSEGMDKEVADTKWAFDVCQNNDLFLYITKNEGYGKTEAIKEIVIDNIQIEAKQEDKIKLYKPDEQGEKQIFKTKEEDVVSNLVYSGGMESNLKQLTISNQGGLIAFRCANLLAEYTSNEEEINHQELLKKVGATQEDLQAKITFDLTIRLEEGKEYKTTINLQLPTGNVIEEGTTSQEITDLTDFKFKR